MPTRFRPAPDAGSCTRDGPAALLDRATRKGKVIKTTSVGGFLLLYALSQLKPLRRRSLRFAAEQAALTDWLDLVAETARGDYALALQVARMRSLVKGYGDTHERGRAKFDKLAALVPRLRGQDNSGARLEGLVKAALADEGDEALDKAIADLGVANSAANDAANSVGSLSPAGRGRGEGLGAYDRTATPHPTPLPAEVGYIRLRPAQDAELG